MEVDTIPQCMPFQFTDVMRETILGELDQRKAIEYEAAATENTREAEVEDDGDWEAMMEDDEGECEYDDCEDEEDNN